jgi:hypothetical protein
LLNCRQLNAPANLFFFINPSGFVPEVEDVKKIQSHHLLKEYAHKLKSHNVSHFILLQLNNIIFMYNVKIAMRAIALVGDPKVEIVKKKVSKLEANVLVMGTRQLGSIKR